MAINFHPKRGTVLMCDFTTGFKQPEMIKRRHVVVISPRYRRHTGLCLVVPFSSVAPFEIEPHHHEILAGKYPFFDPVKSVWAKADMLTCVSFQRLDRVLQYGRYASPMLQPDDLEAIQIAVAEALQLDKLFPVQVL
ncbi:MAG TPA: type II toxin-antitoxin system PemK/MazF family toxin [Bryobacteraceae bacterium]|nr:type II toxin-antitoxin system PemK/MazF family toxin [Bryobacteraceae bacterium]